METASLYCRVSTQRQENERTIESQEAELKETIKGKKESLWRTKNMGRLF